jgi:hypothetical protein
MANTQLLGYETEWANKKVMCVDVVGPASYVNTGTFATSGQPINASDFGWGGFDFVMAMPSSDGLDIGYVASGTSGSSFTTFNLHWFVIATGAEVTNTTNLSTKTIRLLLVGV